MRKKKIKFKVFEKKKSASWTRLSEPGQIDQIYVKKKLRYTQDLMI
jgi:hypothetical protein